MFDPWRPTEDVITGFWGDKNPWVWVVPISCVCFHGVEFQNLSLSRVGNVRGQISVEGCGVVWGVWWLSGLGYQQPPYRVNGGMRRIVNRNIGRPFPSMQVEKKKHFLDLTEKVERCFDWRIGFFMVYKTSTKLVLYVPLRTREDWNGSCGVSTDGRRPDDRKSPRLLDTTPDPLFVITIVFGLFFATL